MCVFSTSLMAYEQCRCPTYDICGLIKNGFYVGVDGGGGIELNSSQDTTSAGLIEDGTPFNIQYRNVYHVGANLGLRFCTYLRSDLSYTYYSGDYTWSTRFSNNFASTSVSGHLKSNVGLANIYLHLNTTSCSYFEKWNIDPYVGGGIGVASNTLDSLTERTANGFEFATVASDTQTTFAARITAGLFAINCSRFAIDVGLHATYLGKMRSENFRNALIGVEEEIGPYKFKSNWVGAIYIGLKYFIDTCELTRALML